MTLFICSTTNNIKRRKINHETEPNILDQRISRRKAGCKQERMRRQFNSSTGYLQKDRTDRNGNFNRKGSTLKDIITTKIEREVHDELQKEHIKDMARAGKKSSFYGYIGRVVRAGIKALRKNK